MSRPLKLTARQIKHLGQALEELSETTRRHGVRLSPYQRLDLEVGDSVVHASWNAEAEAYEIDDQNGD